MPIYVDKEGHLVSTDHIGALHIFAKHNIGLEREQFCNEDKFPHYILLQDQIDKAIDQGAILVDMSLPTLKGHVIGRCDKCNDHLYRSDKIVENDNGIYHYLCTLSREEHIQLIMDAGVSRELAEEIQKSIEESENKE